MTETRANFVDGLRVTALHLNHLQDSALGASLALREIVGVGLIGAGLRIMTTAAGAVVVTPGVAIAADGSPLRLDEETPLTLAADGTFHVLLRSASHDLEAARVGEVPTIVFGDTVVETADGGAPAPNEPGVLVIGSVAMAAGSATITQDPSLFMAPSGHTHSGQFFQDAAGRWRWDGAALAGGGGGGGGRPSRPHRSRRARRSAG